MKKFFLIGLLFSILCSFSYAQDQLDATCMESTSHVDWITKKFSSKLSLDIKKAGITLPSGRNTADVIVKTKAPALIKDPLCSLYVDSANYLGDLVLEQDISLESLTQIIETAKQTPGTFTPDGKNLKSTNTISLENINKILVRHKYPYTPEEPIEMVSSRAYSGIIIDARGSLHVQGEYVESEVYPCFFPTIWDENMNILYEKNTVDRKIAMDKGIVDYNFHDDFSKYADRVGTDPLYIKACKVYGRNRTDPIIRRRDALKILTVEKNKELLKNGKVVVLLDKKNLAYDVSVPEKDPEYYSTYKTIKQYVYNKDYDIDVVPTITGLTFRVDLKFVPDSPELLPEEQPRIEKIAEILKSIINNDEFTILVEGHTADLGKPVGQMNLSIERTRTVMQALVGEGIPQKLFTYKGYGATRPIAPNNTEAGRAQNRRVDITARPRATYIQRDW